MDFLKRYCLWFGLAAALLILLFVQWFVVGGVWESSATANEPNVGKMKKLVSAGKSLSGYPTKKDLEAARKHGAEIKKAGMAVIEQWRDVTDGLNAFMSAGDRADGTILHPVEKEPIRAEVFPQKLRSLYESLFDATRVALVDSMAKKLEAMLAAEVYAGNNLLTLEQANARAARMVKDELKLRTALVDEETLIPVKLTDVYPKDNPEKMWMAWRKYLITEDIFNRVVPKVEAEVARTLMVANPATPEARKVFREKQDLDDPGAEPVKRDQGRTPIVYKAFRWIESIDRFDIADPDVGTLELPALRKKAKPEEAPDTTQSKAVVASPETLDGMDGFDLGELEQVVDAVTVKKKNAYHDSFTVTISLTAHAKVIQAFMREVLRSEGKGFFYVPLSTKIEPFDLKSVTGDYGAEKKKRMKQLREAMGLIEGLGRPVVADAPFTVAGFEHEPPVQGTLVYEVYRFRYKDTDNSAISAIAAKQ